MTDIVEIKAADSPSADSFGRVRTSQPLTLFDSKQLHDNQPLFWDDSEVSGSGTSSSHSSDTASSTMGVSDTTAGRRIRQTFQRFNYQPGKSQLVFMTGTLDKSGGGTGITRCMGLYDDNNGIFFKQEGDDLKMVVRSSTSGSPVDTEVLQSSWNIDRFMGNGPSEVHLDISKSQILVIDFEWLGVGRVRIGFVVNGVVYYAHEFNHANLSAGVYMSTPNLPLRYEIENDGTGAASELEHICSTIISEGGVQETGLLRTVSTAGTQLDANSNGTLYALIGIRLKTTHLDVATLIEKYSVLAETNDDFEYAVYFNPTVAGTFTYSDETNSCMQSALGTTSNTVSGGTYLYGGFVEGNRSSSEKPSNAIKLGSAIDGTRDEFVLCVRPLGANLDIQGSLTWRELS